MRDVDFLRRTISVARPVQGATAGTTTIEAPKYGSERIVYVPADLTDVPAAHVKARGIDQPDEHHPERALAPLGAAEDETCAAANS